MIFPNHLRLCVVRPVLQALQPEIPYSIAAENLIMGTASQESLMSYLVQFRGPALGIYQMEPATFSWLWDDWLEKRPYMKDKFRAFLTEWHSDIPENDMIGNLYFATAMCRLRYWVVPEPLPQAESITGLGAYWKKHYNTLKGKGTVEDFVRHYELTQDKRA